MNCGDPSSKNSNRMLRRLEKFTIDDLISNFYGWLSNPRRQGVRFFYFVCNKLIFNLCHGKRKFDLKEDLWSVVEKQLMTNLLKDSDSFCKNDSNWPFHEQKHLSRLTEMVKYTWYDKAKELGVDQGIEGEIFHDVKKYLPDFKILKRLFIGFLCLEKNLSVADAILYLEKSVPKLPIP